MKNIIQNVYESSQLIIKYVFRLLDRANTLNLYIILGPTILYRIKLVFQINKIHNNFLIIKLSVFI